MDACFECRAERDAPKIWAETTTTFGQAQTTVSTSLPGATSTITTLHQEELKWGETATIEGGAVTVDAPVADPAAKLEPGFMIVYSIVTITNTGGTPISYSQHDFSLEGGHSGGGGSDVQVAAGGQPALEMGTLPPGHTVTGAVRFNLYQDDAPVLSMAARPLVQADSRELALVENRCAAQAVPGVRIPLSPLQKAKNRVSRPGPSGRVFASFRRVRWQLGGKLAITETEENGPEHARFRSALRRGSCTGSRPPRCNRPKS